MYSASSQLSIPFPVRTSCRAVPEGVSRGIPLQLFSCKWERTFRKESSQRAQINCGLSGELLVLVYVLFSMVYQSRSNPSKAIKVFSDSLGLRFQPFLTYSVFVCLVSSIPAPFDGHLEQHHPTLCPLHKVQ